MWTKFKMADICDNLIIWKNAECPIKDLKKVLGTYLEIIFPGV
jgi:hypothetical protein